MNFLDPGLRRDDGAFAGMTVAIAGMTVAIAGMTVAVAGMTPLWLVETQY